MKNFKDIEFKPDIIGGVRGTLEIENGMMISVVAGKFNYCTPREDSPVNGWSSFEVAVLDSYGNFITKRIVDDAGGDVLGWQSREDINDLITKMYNYEPPIKYRVYKETKELFLQWIDEGNAHETRDGVWVEQTTQWKKEFTLRQLMRFFVKEYIWIF